MSSHTPGPWTVSRPTIRSLRYLIDKKESVKGQRLAIAHIDDVDGFEGSTDANAQLIATAPDLLKVLEDIQRRYAPGGTKVHCWLCNKDKEHGPGCVYPLIVAVITKARRSQE